MTRKSFTEKGSNSESCAAFVCNANQPGMAPQTFSDFHDLDLYEDYRPGLFFVCLGFVFWGFFLIPLNLLCLI